MKHCKLDLDEIQSLDLHKIVRHKLIQAYAVLQTPVIVEDVALEFFALGGLPGPFIKFFIENNSLDNVCRMLDGMDRSATARCVIGYCDAHTTKLFEGSLSGSIAEHPSGDRGYGWDKIFIPQGYELTRPN